MRFWSGFGAVLICLVLGSFVSAATFGTGTNQFTMDFVTISGDTNPSSGYGIVDYTYQIGTYEVTAGQYTAFLNAVAASDKYTLYSTWMTSTYGCQIQRSGTSGSYTYSVTDEYADLPVNYVSWYDAARFTNWLNSGDTESGVYNTTTWDVVDVSGTAYWIPTEDEWVKAAYWNGTNLQTWATSDGSTPVAGTDSNFAWSVGGTWDVGSGSDELNGTSDMMGNVWEWNAAEFGSLRGLRGGAFYNNSSYQASSSRYDYYPTNEYYGVGFRVASSSVGAVPEPGSLIIWACGSLGAVVLRRRRR